MQVDGAKAGTNDLESVHGLKSQAMAVGAANTVVRSYDFGDTWELVAGPKASAVLSNVVMLAKNIALVSTGGELYRTEDFGSSWSQVNLPFEISTINEIAFRKNEASQSLLGHLVGTDGTKAIVARSTDGGASWVASTKQIAAGPTGANALSVAVSNLKPSEVAVGGVGDVFVS